uniref:Uncharacterized protein n=1 Tax=Arundo donax TaxID=35708 RepID=A0A0A9B341_ARUDO
MEDLQSRVLLWVLAEENASCTQL